MKYKLISNNKSSSIIQQVLINRGIPKATIPHYLHTKDQDINTPQKFGQSNLKSAAIALISNINNSNNAVVIVDSDLDGFTSSAIIINYLYDLFPTWVTEHLSWYFHSGKQHGLNDCIDWIIEEKFSLVICPDSSSNDYIQHRRLKQLNIPCIVLDHHDADKVDANAIIINNQLSNYPNKELSGAGVTWQFCRYIDSLLNFSFAEKYIDLAALGACGDMMDYRSIETKHLVLKGFSQIQNPFFDYMADKNSYSMKNQINYNSVAFYVVPFVNAIVRSGNLEQKRLIFNSMLNFKSFQKIPSTKRGHRAGDTEKLVQQAIRVATNVKARQKKSVDAGLQLLERKIQQEHLLDHKVLLILIEPGQIDKNIAGLIANKYQAKYQRPTCILTKKQEDGYVSYQGSARGCNIVGVADFKSICLETEKVLYAEGHGGAFGLGIREEDIQDFLILTDAALKDMPDEPTYYVDYICYDSRPDKQLILSIANNSDLWGKNIDEPQIAISNLKITSDMVTVYDKKGYTLKITLPNGINIIKFSATEEDIQIFRDNNSGYKEVNLIATCQANEWMGEITPQLFLIDYQVVDSNEYFF